MKSNWLTLATLAGVIVGKFSPNSQFNLILPILGIALGIGLRESREKPWSKRESQLYVGFLGQLFLNMLKCVIIPLVIPSLITAIGKFFIPHNLFASGHFDSSQFSPKSAIFGGFEKKKFPKVTATKDILCMLPKYIFIHGFRPPLVKNIIILAKNYNFPFFQKLT